MLRGLLLNLLQPVFLGIERAHEALAQLLLRGPVPQALQVLADALLLVVDGPALLTQSDDLLFRPPGLLPLLDPVRERLVSNSGS